MLRSRQIVLRMTLVVANQHHTDTFGASLVKDMIGNEHEVGTPETVIGSVKAQRVFCRPLADAHQFRMKLIGQTPGDFAVIRPRFPDISPHQRVL